jgi:hypothetical protein
MGLMNTSLTTPIRLTAVFKPIFCSDRGNAHLARIIHEASTTSADPGMSTSLRSVGLLDVLSSTPAEPSVARLVSMPVCAASLRTFMNNAG